jgi:hypothetical protein
MKTYNNHPQWYNQPLRLTKEQKSDPLPVLDDFFECYHLNEVRQTFWEWLTEVHSSQRSIAIEPLDRSNYIYFYEKIEGVIEAAFVLKKRIHKHRRRWEKRKLKKGNQLGKDQAVRIAESPDKLSTAVESVENGAIFIKPKQLLEYVDEAPIYVVIEVFKNESLAFLRDQLRDWLHVALSADCHIYEDGENRRQLFSFQDHLLVLIEALFIIYTQNADKADIEKQITEADKPRLLSRDQIGDPMQVLIEFFKKFPITYSIRELDDWLEAGIAYAGDYPENMSEYGVLLIYRNVLCLIKAAHRLLRK